VYEPRIAGPIGPVRYELADLLSCPVYRDAPEVIEVDAMARLEWVPPSLSVLF